MKKWFFLLIFFVGFSKIYANAIHEGTERPRLKIWIQEKLATEVGSCQNHESFLCG